MENTNTTPITKRIANRIKTAAVLTIGMIPLFAALAYASTHAGSASQTIGFGLEGLAASMASIGILSETILDSKGGGALAIFAIPFCLIGFIALAL